jgi:hypothetical protein
MTHKLHHLMLEMLAWEAGNPHRSQHLLKVWAFARAIAREEALEENLISRIEAAALVHDIGIRPALEKHGSSAGPLQEKEGIAPARALLTRLGFAPEEAERVAALVGCHHTTDPVIGIDHQILLEADFLVNLHEGQASEQAIASVRESVFKTASGIKLLDQMFMK